VYIKSRVKNAVVMAIILAIMPIAAAIGISSGRVGEEYVIVVIVCATFQAMGILYYIGFYEIMTGFTTMSKEEIKQYNTENITSFLGIALTISTQVSFYLGMIISIKYGTGSGVITMITILTITVTISFMYTAIGKKFRHQIDG